MMNETTPGTVTLMGSGEMADSMAKVHRAALERIAGPVHAVFVDTPAGFEVNADDISARAVDYLGQRFGVSLEVAQFKSKAHATAADTELALRKLVTANYIFAGPGSPSYAARNWHGTPLWEMIVARVMAGAHLVLASAAAIAASRCALPVYEIYKAGDDPHWIDGLDLFMPFGLSLAIVPHWNNAEGGTHDTRFCYMGEARMAQLRELLPSDVVVLGIDEYTACVVDPGAQTCTVMGAGTATVRKGDAETVFAAGTSFPFDALRAPEQPDAAPWAMPDPELLGATLYLSQLARAIDEGGEPDSMRELIGQAHETLHNLSGADAPPADDSAPYVELLVATRSRLRAAKQYTLADEIRKQLAARGIQIEDTPQGARWTRGA